MPTIRTDLSSSKPYYLPKHEFLETYHFCLQYGDWIVTYNDYESQLKAIRYDKEKVSGGKISDAMADIAIRRERLRDKLKLIEGKLDLVERVAAEVEPIYTDGFIKAMTTERMNYRRAAELVPLPRREYFLKRRLFYYRVHELRSGA